MLRLLDEQSGELLAGLCTYLSRPSLILVAAIASTETDMVTDTMITAAYAHGQHVFSNPTLIRLEILYRHLRFLQQSARGIDVGGWLRPQMAALSGLPSAELESQLHARTTAAVKQ